MRKRERNSAKPLFKRWWFWVLAIMLAGNLFSGTGEKSEEPVVPDTLLQNESVEAAKEKPLAVEDISIKKISGRRPRIRRDK